MYIIVSYEFIFITYLRKGTHNGIEASQIIEKILVRDIYPNVFF